MQTERQLSEDKPQPDSVRTPRLVATASALPPHVFPKASTTSRSRSQNRNTKKRILTRSDSRHAPAICMLNNYKQLVRFEDGAWRYVIQCPEWIDGNSTTCATKFGIIVVSGKSGRSIGRYIIKLDVTNKHIKQLPPCRDSLETCGVAYCTPWIYIVGGVKSTIARRVSDNGFKWEIIAPLKHGVHYPIVLHNHGRIIVFGGYDADKEKVTHTQVYNISSNEWTLGDNMPIRCDALDSGGVVYQGNILIFTKTCAMRYDVERNSWQTSIYLKFADNLHPFMHNHKILVSAKTGEKHYLWQYDPDKNNWMKENIALNEALFTDVVFSV